jgi:hypothetical protein
LLASVCDYCVVGVEAEEMSRLFFRIFEATLIITASSAFANVGDVVLQKTFLFALLLAILLKDEL